MARGKANKRASERSKAQPLKCSRCETEAVGVQGHAGKVHQACGDKTAIPNTDPVEYRFHQTRVKGEGSPRDGGKWVTA